MKEAREMCSFARSNDYLSEEVREMEAAENRAVESCELVRWHSLVKRPSKIARTHLRAVRATSGMVRYRVTLHIHPEHVSALGMKWGDAWQLGFGRRCDENGVQLTGPLHEGRFVMFIRNPKWQYGRSPQVRINTCGSADWTCSVDREMIENGPFHGLAEGRIYPDVVIDRTEDNGSILVLMFPVVPPSVEKAAQVADATCVVVPTRHAEDQSGSPSGLSEGVAGSEVQVSDLLSDSGAGEKLPSEADATMPVDLIPEREVHEDMNDDRVRDEDTTLHADSKSTGGCECDHSGEERSDCITAEG